MTIPRSAWAIGAGVVHAVTDHCDDVSFTLEGANDLDLADWENAGVNLGDTEEPADRVGRPRRIAGEEDQAESELSQLVDRRDGGRFERVSDREGPDVLSRDGEEEDRLPVRLEGGELHLVADLDVRLREECSISEEERPRFRGRLDSATW